jgi:amino acid adenylation domain-containing protein
MHQGAIEGFLLSPQQKQLWQRFEHDSAQPYRVQCRILIEGQLDRAALERAVQQVVQHYEILRTTFHCLPGMSLPVQVIGDGAEIALRSYDLSALSTAARAAELAALETRLHQQPFEQTDAAQESFALVQLAPARHALIVTFSALCADTVALRSVVEALGAAYAAIRAGADFDAETMQYADFSEWQNGELDSEDAALGAAYWRKQDFTPLAQTQLPFVAAGARFDPATLAVTLDAATVAQLQAHAAQSGAALSTLLLAGWQALLWRITQQPQIMIGVGANGRKYDEIAAAPGLFARYIPLSVAVEDAAFSALLRDVDRAVQDASNWDEFFYWDRLEQAAAELGEQPSFPICFDFETLPAAQRFDAVTFAIAAHTARIDRFVVKLSCLQQADQALLQLDYDQQRLSPVHAARLLRQFETLLDAVAAQPDAAIGALPLLGDDELALLRSFNQTDAAYPADARLDALFERQAERVPDAVAVALGAQTMTYAELDRRANQLAHHLQALGVGPETLVALCLDRSLDLAVALLGVLKAGGAYVPLDPGYPIDRLQFMLSDTQAALLLTQERLLNLLPETDATTLSLDRDWPTIAERPVTRPAQRGASDNLAYVIYTSGSTGQPKGVGLPHRAVCNHMHWLQSWLQLDERDRVLQKTSFGFDASVLEFFAAWNSGARLVLAKPGGQQDSAYLAELVRDERITFLQAVPSLLRVLLAEPAMLDQRALRQIICAGEALPSDLAAQVAAKLPAVQLHNLYGPTEASIDVTARRCAAHEPAPIVAIGQPIANVQTFILDRYLQPAPVGVAGELYIGGVQLARGYLKRPALTAERFIPDPFSDQPGARLYKTGDLARYQPDGVIEFLGRIDQQIKLRGFRVELGEIEAVLNQHPDVAAAVVIGREDAGDLRLVAYVVPEQRTENTEQKTENKETKEQRSQGTDHRPSITDHLPAFLAQRLPEYMVPSAFVTLPALPRTPGGKLDRTALPAPEAQFAEAASLYVAPRTMIEELLADIWADVLRTERISIHDHFFALGGHSLLATQVMARVRQTFRVEIALRTLFSAPTIAELAQHIQAALSAGNVSAAPPIKAVSRDGALLLSFAQQRLWFLDQLEPNSPAYNLPGAVEITGPLDQAALIGGLNQIVARHEVLRTNFAVVDGQAVQQIAPTREIPFATIDLRALPADERAARVQQLTHAEALRPFNLAHDSLIRGTLIALEDEAHVLLLTMHHIVSDAWSTAVLLRELVAFYEAAINQRSAALTPLAVQYADYAAWQRHWLQGETLEQQLAYWRQHLADAPAVLNLPTDRPRPPVQTFNGAIRTFTIAPELLAALQSFSRREEATLFMTTLAAFKALLLRYTNQPDLVVGTSIANRTQTETSDLIGFFINTLALRTNLEGNPSFREALQRVREVTLGAYAHQELPFEKLVETLQPSRDLSHAPIFQVLFELQNAPAGALELPGLTLRQLPSDSGTAKFDLNLSLTESAEGLAGLVEYNTDLFDAATIDRLIGHYQRILSAAVSEPERPIGALALLSDAERAQFERWNQTARSYPAASTLAELFEAQVARTPEATAVVFASGGERVERLSYAELNQRANVLAQRLIAAGVGSNQVVGILAERGVHFLAATLAIFKAGGAYLPLDPNYPAARVRQVLAQSGVARVLVTEPLRPQLAAALALMDAARPAIITLDATLAHGSAPNPPRRSAPDDLAYVIYTSGSTGLPKGALVEQRGMINHIFAKIEDLSLTAADRIAQNASQCFDISIWQLFTALLLGGQVHIYDDAIAHDPAALIAATQQHGTTILEIVPSFLRTLLLDQARQPLPALRWLILTGEALPPDVCRQWLAHYPAIPILNAYGPTECSDDVTHHAITAAPAAHLAQLPIGKPVANMRAYVLDRAGALAPLGVAGELYIGGVGVGRGYLNDPRRTAEVFTPDPFGPEPGARLYKTGDLVRWLADGTIEFLGRIDHQVKIRGFRIELGEIEAVLNQRADVSDAAVVAREETPGNQYLVAYVVLDQTTTLDELRAEVQTRLPGYMVPSVWLELTALPLTANGKLDRKALPAPVRGAASNTAFVAPRNDLELALATIWGEILGRERIGVHDDFFTIGGHSLLATQVVSRIRTIFKLDLPLRVIFEATTIAQLSEALPAHEPQPGQVAKIARLLQQIKARASA